MGSISPEVHHHLVALGVGNRDIYVESLPHLAVVLLHLGQGLVPRSGVLRGFQGLGAFWLLVIYKNGQRFRAALGPEAALHRAPLVHSRAYLRLVGEFAGRKFISKAETLFNRSKI